jgi:hypothetical protein
MPQRESPGAAQIALAHGVSGAFKAGSIFAVLTLLLTMFAIQTKKPAAS